MMVISAKSSNANFGCVFDFYFSWRAHNENQNRKFILMMCHLRFILRQDTYRAKSYMLCCGVHFCLCVSVGAGDCRSARLVRLSVCGYDFAVAGKT